MLDELLEQSVSGQELTVLTLRSSEITELLCEIRTRLPFAPVSVGVNMLELAALATKQLERHLDRAKEELKEIKAEITRPKELAVAALEKERSAVRESVRDALMIAGDTKVAGWQLIQDKEPTYILPEDLDQYENLARFLLDYAPHTVKLTIRDREIQQMLKIDPQLLEMTRDYGVDAELKTHVRIVI